MLEKLFKDVLDKEKTKAIENLFERSAPDKDFFLLLFFSVLMATFGLLINSSTVIIGSMLIAPILYPILGISMGIVMSDFSLVSKSLNTLLKAIFLVVGAAFLTTLLFLSQIQGLTEEIIKQTKPSLLYGAVGVISGFAASFALVKPKLSETLPGVAVSVALLPPLAVMGIGLAQANLEIAINSLLLFIINALGVIFTAVIVFSLMNFYIKREKALKIVEEQEKKREGEE